MASAIESFLVRLERQRVPWAAPVLVVVAPAIGIASSKPLWFDELLTFHIAGLARLGDIPTALADGADVQPLLSYVLTRASLGLFGGSELAVRLPSLAAFAVACWAVFRFTSRRAGAAAAASAVFFFGLTEAFALAYEARPYGLLLAFTSLALLSWAEIAREGRRNAALAGLALSLAAGLASHYYAVLAFVPVAIGESARTWRRRRFDPAVWAAMAAGSLALAAHLPLVRAIRSIYTGGFWSPAEPLDLVGSYVYLLAPAFFPVLSVVVLWAAMGRRGVVAQSKDRLLFEERAALAALAAIPFVAVPLALLVTKAYVYRFASPALIGLSILFGLGAERAGGRRGTAAATALLLLGWFAGERVLLSPRAGNAAKRAAAVERLSDPRTMPVAVTSPLLYSQQQHYSGPGFADRLVYLSDPDWALRQLGTNSPDLNLTRLRRWAPLHVEDYSDFMAAHTDFFLCRQPGDRFDWITARLRGEGKRLRRVGSAGSLEVLRCCE